MKKITAVLLSFILIYMVVYFSFSKIELKNSNSLFVNRLLRNSNYYFNKDFASNNYLYNFINFFNDIELNRPITIVEKKFYKSSHNIEFGYIENMVIDKPQVYIYSTHYTEGYTDGKTVVDASYLLQKELNELGIMTIVSERSVGGYIKENSLTYKDSYLATRAFLKDILKEYPNLDLIIDLHRDATSPTATTTTIDNVSYAKIMFVMNENYPNMEVASRLNEIVLSKKNITRGIYHKKVDNFNQDLNKNVILIEMGGNYNSFSEVENSTLILANSIKEFIDEKS